MKQMHLAGLIGSLTVGLVLAHAGDVKAEAAGQSPRATSNQAASSLQGSIVAVNMDKRRLQVREQDGRIVTVPIAPSAKITREGRSSALIDLAVGQQINIQQQAQRDGKSIATSIDVLASAVAPAGAVPGMGSSSANPGFNASGAASTYGSLTSPAASGTNLTNPSSPGVAGSGAAKDAAGTPPISNTQ